METNAGQQKSGGRVAQPQDQNKPERLVLGHSSRFQALLEQSRQRIRDGKGLSRDAFWEAVSQRYGDTEEADQE